MASSSAWRQRRSHSESCTLDNAIQPSVFGASRNGATSSALTLAARLNARTASGKPLVVAVVLEDRRPSLFAGREVPAHALARQIERRPVGAFGRVGLAADVRHPEIAGARCVVEQPDAAGVRLGVVHQALDEHAEEAAKVGVRHQQIERELNRIALDRGHALGALAVVVEVLERGLQPCDLDVLRGFLPERHRFAGLCGCGHALDYERVRGT